MRIKKVFIVLISLALSVILVACGETPSSTTDEQANNSESSDTSNSVTKDDDWPRGITIATSSAGGFYYAYGGAWANILDFIPISPESSAGGVDNVKLVEAGNVEVGIASDGILYDGLHGIDWAEGQEYSNVRAMFPMSPGYFQIVAKSGSGIESIHDLEGRRFVTGAAGTGSDTYLRRLLDHFDIKADIININYGDAVGQLNDGMIDAFGVAPTGVPHPATSEFMATNDAVIIGVSEEDLSSLQEVYPYMQSGYIPAGTYDGIDEDVHTITMWNIYLAHKELPDSLVYALVEETYKNYDRLATNAPSAEETLPENIKYLTVPLHSGAAQYFEENGYEIPEQAKPID
ncbi:TAXI family TRAP transporter solute-binding subunit [Alkalihalobacterium alkalinitrilicum]|uniref:TAXI family TRAP transporter solute-binding subunit n=1 Tax=Alkalihalobacterium alkalinitrilicum TaxID=427920 RepID=UPI00099491ED|nr:TAXI family TRAP transporter solute-binding subunit [Alkalihalobacterium alkalinitrilicum]